jgi:hypothetical protein
MGNNVENLSLHNIFNKKKVNNIIKIYINNINLYNFESFIRNILHQKKYNNIISKKYNKYYNRDEIYIIYDNGIEYFLKYINRDKEILDLNNKKLKIEIIDFENVMQMEVKYSYDKIKKIDSIIFDFYNFDIECSRIINLKTNKITHEIIFLIKKTHLHDSSLSLINELLSFNY